jgi:hypothetical protein
MAFLLKALIVEGVLFGSLALFTLFMIAAAKTAGK